MQEVSINEYLSIDNVWTRRLLGYESFQKVRNQEQIEREYNQDVYGKMLAEEFKGVSSFKQAQQQRISNNAKKLTCVSVKDKIYKVKLNMANQFYRNLVKTKVEQYSSGIICEMGCGYGQNIGNLDGEVYGGEYSENAVKLASRLGLEVYPFDYYNPQAYDILRDEVTVLTVHSIEQLPDARCFLDGLFQHKDQIRNVVHLEPTILPERKNLLGLLRNRYMEINDYNRNLLVLLQSNPDIEIIEYETDLFGLNPLNPANLIVWRFN